MELPVRTDRLSKVPLRYIPLTVLTFTLVSWYITVNHIGYFEIFPRSGFAILFSPFTYTVNMFFHAGGWSHFAGNMELWIPFGTLLTWLTSNRHVLGLAFTVNFLTVAVALTIEGIGLGMSHVVFGVMAATLVRSAGYALQNTSATVVQTMVTWLLLLGVFGFFVIMILAGPRVIADFYHLLGFLFGGAIEAIYVFEAHESDSGTRSIPSRIGG